MHRSHFYGSITAVEQLGAFNDRVQSHCGFPSWVNELELGNVQSLQSLKFQKDDLRQCQSCTPSKRISVLHPVGSRVAARAHHKILELQRDLSTSQGSTCVSPVFAHKLYPKKRILYTKLQPKVVAERDFFSFLHQLLFHHIRFLVWKPSFFW